MARHLPVESRARVGVLPVDFAVAAEAEIVMTKQCPTCGGPYLPPVGQKLRDAAARIAELEAEVARLKGAPEPSAAQWIEGPPKTPGWYVVHRSSGRYDALKLEAFSNLFKFPQPDNYGILRHFPFVDLSAYVCPTCQQERCTCDDSAVNRPAGTK